MEFRSVAKFKYLGCTYEMFLSNENKRFFLEIDENGQYQYLTLEKLIRLDEFLLSIPKVMNIEKGKKFIFSPKVYINGVLATLSLATLLSGCYRYKSNSSYKIDLYANIEPKAVQSDVAFETQDKDEPLEIDYYNVSDRLKYKYVYDMDYGDLVFDYDYVTVNQIISRINVNSRISDKYKPIFIEFVNMIHTAYPKADLRILFENLETLEIVECEDKLELMSHTLSYDSYACYVRTENKIYVLKDYEYKKGTWEYQVIMHELAHASRSLWTKKDGYNIKMQSGGLNVSQLTLEEALNSLYVVKAFDYEERDIAYQLQSNYYGIIIDCMDNYELTDYANHSLSYFAAKLDEFTGYTNYATVIFELVELQYDDFHSDSIEIDPTEFRPLYEYVFDIYFKTHLTSDMTKSDALALVDELVEKLTFDVPEEYNIDVPYFYEYFDTYCQKNGLFDVKQVKSLG